MPDIKHMIAIDAPLERVHGLVSSGAGFAKWWAEDVTEDGSKKALDLGFFNRTTIYQLKLAHDAKPSETEWHCSSGKEWVGTKLRFKMARNKEQTVLRFEHLGWAAETDYFVSCNTTWGELMFRLKAGAEGKGVGPLFKKNGLAY